MASTEPLSTLLSQALVAHTMELDNEFEERLARTGERARVTSVVMWSNFLRFVGDGITVGELPVATNLPKTRVLSTLGGMERWGYVVVGLAGRAPNEQRDGRGSARGLRTDWLVQPTGAGRAAQAIWPGLFEEIDERWSGRFGARAVEALRDSSKALLGPLDLALPEYVPIIASTDGFAAGLSPEPGSGRPLPTTLGPLLAQVLLAYTLEFERTSDLSLALTANVVRVVATDGMLVRDVPAASGISKEAVSVALTALTRSDHASVEGTTAATKTVRLTTMGEAARREAPAIHAAVESAWVERHSADALTRLRTTLDAVLDHADLASGLRPHAEGWRASKPYAARTEALLANPRATLPHYPMVLHRGGWPDGS